MAKPNSAAASSKPVVHTVPGRSAAVKVAVWYAVVGASWIFATDWLLHYAVKDRAWINLLENVKGWLFVLVTALLLWWALNRYFREIRRSSREIRESEERWQFAIEGSGVGSLGLASRFWRGVLQRFLEDR